MKFASFNVQYGIGLDGKFDAARIADAVKGADIIAMQEVTRNFGRNGHADLPGIFADLLPDRYHAFGAGLVVDELIGQEDIVVKSFDAAQGGLTLFSGATILSDGAPALIVDVGSLL